jgi:hypothetical protein
MWGERPDRVRLEFRLGLLVAAGAVAVLLGGALGTTSGKSTDPGHRYTSERRAFSVSVPPGWRRSPERLVPRLLMPREIVSLGTFEMPVGQGGNCGREPVAATRRMRPGDALVTVQEYVVTARMRGHLTHNFPPLSAGLRLRRLQRSYAAAEAGRRVTTATVPFSEHGRAFDALFYFAGRPTPRLRHAAVAIVEGMQFGPRL